MQGSVVCDVCSAPAGGDSYFTPSGEQVCRVCYYAEQTRREADRIENDPGELGLVDSVHLVRGLIVGGLLVLFGLAGTLSSLRHGQWRDAAFDAGLLALGLVVSWFTFGKYRRRSR